MRFLNASLKFKTSYFLFLSAFILILSIYTPTVHAAQISLAWDQNTEQDLSGYKIYYGTSSDNYTFSIDVGKTTSYTLSSLESGKTYYTSVTAYDTEGYESDFSDEVSFATPPECTFSISPVNQSLEAPGGAGAVNVTTQSGCGWVVNSSASWLIITSNSSGTGNGVINYSVLENTDSSSRTGTLTIASNK